MEKRLRVVSGGKVGEAHDREKRRCWEGLGDGVTERSVLRSKGNGGGGRWYWRRTKRTAIMRRKERQGTG